MKKKNIYNNAIFQYMIAIIIVALVFLSMKYIAPDKTEEIKRYRSSELYQMKENKGNMEVITYVNNKGETTFATDVGYAIKKTTKTKEGTLEQFLDASNKPVLLRDGYASVYCNSDKDGNIRCIVYIGEDGKLTTNRYGIAIVTREYDDNLRVIMEHYYDKKMQPTCSNAYGYGRRNMYNANGEIEEITYLDKNDKPMLTQLGYAGVRRKYYRTNGIEKGKVEFEFYYNEIKEPISLSNGQYGVHKSYNEYGQESELIFLDADGNPIVTRKGYTRIVRTYHEDNTIKTEHYYDIEGKPFKLSEGQTGKMLVNGYTYYLNADGSEAFNIRNCLHNKPWLSILLGVIIIIISVNVTQVINKLLIVFYLGAIIYMTLLFREHGLHQLNLDFFRSYRSFVQNSNIRSDVIKNIWLFIPFGAIAFQIYPEKRTLFIPFILSILIEIIQYYSGVGICEVDDIINNGLGGTIGYYTGMLFQELKRRFRGQYMDTKKDK